MPARTMTSFWVLLLTFVAPATSSLRADDNEVPEDLRGTWVLRLFSDDGGKSYKSGGNVPLCTVSAREVKLLKKVDFADEKLAVKSVVKFGQREAAGRAIHFENGSVWRVTQIGGSINVAIGKEQDGAFKESHRITVRRR